MMMKKNQEPEDDEEKKGKEDHDKNEGKNGEDDVHKGEETNKHLLNCSAVKICHLVLYKHFIFASFIMFLLFIII